MKGSLKTGRSKRSIGWYLAHDWQLWVMLLPAVVYIFIFGRTLPSSADTVKPASPAVNG